jgi:hypothetical protein
MSQSEPFVLRSSQGEVRVYLDGNGWVNIESPVGPEIVTIWTKVEGLAADLVDHGVDPAEAMNVAQTLTDQRDRLSE